MSFFNTFYLDIAGRKKSPGLFGSA